MSGIINSHIQGNLTITSNSNTDNGLGILFTDLLQEATQNSGVSVMNSELIVNSGEASTGVFSIKNDLAETGQLILNSSGNAAANGIKSLTLLNNSGNLFLQSKGNVGIKVAETTGNVLIQSTAESINSSSASLVVSGGVSINKSIIVDKEIRGNDGLHLLFNTQVDESVLQIQNTSTSGLSSIDFKDSNEVVRLQLGYGNSGVTSPLTSQSYLQSSSGTLLLRSNNTDSILLKTDGSAEFKNTSSSTSYTTGAITSLGGIGISNTTDATSSTNGGTITTAGGISVAKKAYIGTDLDIGSSIRIGAISTPSAPVSGKKFFIDTTDGFLKSLDPINTVKIYNPNTTKGDLITHNGIIDIRLPVGSNGQVLSANPSVSSGLEWVDASFTEKKKTTNLFTLRDTDDTYIVDKVAGSWYSCLAPLCLDGASCIYFLSKSSHTVNRGHVFRMCNNVSLINEGSLGVGWNTYKSIRINKDYAEGNGDYTNDGNKDLNSTTVSLSGTSWVSLGTEYNVNTGCFYVSVYSYDGGPCNTFVICKTDASLNAASTFIISSSASILGTILNLRWLANTGIEISKNSNDNNGEYNVINNFQNGVSGTITLTGNTPTTIPKSFFNFYENKSFIMSVTSAVSGSPKAVFFVSKNSNTKVAAQVSNRSPGITSLEQIFITWNANSLITVYKNGINYDGIYNIQII